MKVLLVLALVAAATALPRVSRRIPGGGKIVGGIDAKEGEFPYQLSLLWSGSHICGATLVSPKLAITAAHCVEGDSPSNIKVVAGVLDRRETTGMEQTISVSKINVHRQYNGNTFANDIAALVLSTEAVMNDVVAPAGLPEPQQDSTGEITVSGWGTTRESGSLANVLQHVTIPTINDADCQEMYPQETILESMLCAGLPEGGKDSCQGDSGGPLVEGRGKDAVLVGIVSWGYGCARAGYPGVNTQVSYFRDWIEANSA
jgi:secreted trypsin-like serine protease